MNVANLTVEEQHQLQALLNKMNSAPKEITAVEQMIGDILNNFDFDKVQVTMENLNWKWAGEWVSTDMLINQAKRLLETAAEIRLGEYKDSHWELGIMSATGGLQATAFCDEDKTKIIQLELKFVLTEWESETA